MREAAITIELPFPSTFLGVLLYSTVQYVCPDEAGPTRALAGGVQVGQMRAVCAPCVTAAGPAIRVASSTRRQVLILDLAKPLLVLSPL